MIWRRAEGKEAIRRGGLGDTLADAGSASELTRLAVQAGLIDAPPPDTPRRDLAARATEVLADPRARPLVARGAGGLAEAAAAVLFDLDLEEVCVVGGMNRSPVWRGEFKQALARSHPTARLVTARLEPVLGAARLARGLKERVV